MRWPFLVFVCISTRVRLCRGHGTRPMKTMGASSVQQQAKAKPRTTTATTKTTPHRIKSSNKKSPCTKRREMMPRNRKRTETKRQMTVMYRFIILSHSRRLQQHVKTVVFLQRTKHSHLCLEIIIIIEFVLSARRIYYGEIVEIATVLSLSLSLSFRHTSPKPLSHYINFIILLLIIFSSSSSFVLVNSA